jgi:sulfopyruvate decarboxylase subunit alpha
LGRRDQLRSPQQAQAVPADVVLRAMDAAGVSDVVTVPDTNQRTVLEHLDQQGRISLHRAATEDDVLGVCAGLWMGGRRPVALIQQLGLFAAANSLRAFTHDFKIPLVIIAGLYGRELELEISESRSSAVRLCIPLLDALEVAFMVLEEPTDPSTVAAWLGRPFERPGGTMVVLLGAPTC